MLSEINTSPKMKSLILCFLLLGILASPAFAGKIVFSELTMELLIIFPL